MFYDQQIKIHKIGGVVGCLVLILVFWGTKSRLSIRYGGTWIVIDGIILTMFLLMTYWDIECYKRWKEGKSAMLLSIIMIGLLVVLGGILSALVEAY